MTYKQIEEALKYCPTHDSTNYCDKCPLNSIMGCRNELMIKAFDTIQKLKEERIDRLKEENESFENNMKSVLEIEKKQAVKEFAENLKRKFRKYYISTDNYCCSVKGVNANDIDELLKEYEK